MGEHPEAVSMMNIRSPKVQGAILLTGVAVVIGMFLYVRIGGVQRLICLSKLPRYTTQQDKLTIPPEFEFGEFVEGLARVRVGDKWSFIDNTGKLVIPPKFGWVENFKEGLAMVVVGGRVGFIDKAGKLVIPPQFDEAEHFREGLARVKVGDKHGYIDKSGKLILPRC